ncbi:MAG: ArgP/LysG family DNA-binding transcriptional regulator, partial [Natronospirillum sp.]
MLDYRLLGALAAVVEQGGFERAASQLHLTQSAVSQRIKQLEHQLGQPVLIRSNPPQTTPLGQRLHNHWQQVRLLESGLALAGDDTPLTLRIAVNADSLATWFPAALVMADYDSVRFDIVVEDQAVGLRRMRQGDVMACLCGAAEPVNGGRVVPVGNFRYRAVASPDFIDRYRLRHNVANLAHAPCLVFNRDDPLQHRFMADIGAGEPQRVHLLPSSEGFVQA